jgi:hypothetical protein
VIDKILSCVLKFDNNGLLASSAFVTVDENDERKNGGSKVDFIICLFVWVSSLRISLFVWWSRRKTTDSSRMDSNTNINEFSLVPERGLLIRVVRRCGDLTNDK